MARLDEEVSGQFGRWERRGRGWQVYDEPVRPEPPFRPFLGYYLPPIAVDDGRKPSVGSSLLTSFSRWLSPQPPELPPLTREELEPEPEAELLCREDIAELQAVLPAKFDGKSDRFHDFLSQLGLCAEPVSFEIVGTSERIVIQFAMHPRDAPLVRRQLQAYCPEVMFLPQQNTLAEVWTVSEENESAVVEFGLAREFVYPLATGRLDPFIGIMAALSELEADEIGLFQIMFQQVRHEWAESVERATTGPDGKPLFVNEPELTKAMQEKVASPLFAAVLRIATQAPSFDRAWNIVRDLASSLRVFSRIRGNELIPLANDEYPYENHIEDVIRRQCRRPGMLLNSDELISLVHLPTAAVHAPKLERDLAKSRLAPVSVMGAQGVILGENRHAGKVATVRLTPAQRVQHTHVIGVQGTGKSTLLFNLIRQDIENGEGIAVLDPHGDLVEQILGIIPVNRVNDVVLVDPSDEQYSVGFNILSAHSDLEKNLLASDLVSAFQRLSTSWGDQMGSVLQNAILAFLESSQGGTLADLRQFLIEPAFRERFLKTVRDPDIVYYWRKGFTQLSGNKSIGPVLTRLETLLSPKPIRYMVAQEKNRLDFANILDTGKIFLAKLPQGQMGKENAFLLGSLFVAKFQETAMSRQAQRIESRRPFFLYVDEFQNFITPSMAEILTGARKYRLGLILAHQELRQLERDREVASAVLSNPYTRVVFRVGDSDARTLENGLSHFEARDLQNLERGQAICRVEKSDGDFNLSIPLLEYPGSSAAEATRQAVVSASRARYATPRAEVEAALLAKLEAEAEPVKTKPIPPVPKVAEKKSAEAPNNTVSEEKKPVDLPVFAPPVAEAPPSKEAAEPKPMAPADMGRGGEQHKTIQKRLKEIAEQIGFRVTVEKEVLNGDGSIDLALERTDHTIACEITISTSIDHEFGNVKKCIKAGFGHVAVISPSAAKLRQLEQAVRGALDPQESARVGYYVPDDFIAYLRALPIVDLPPPSTPTETTVRGYTVRRHKPTLTTEERQAKEQVAMRTVAEAVKGKR